jgi:hypothetical protein
VSGTWANATWGPEGAIAGDDGAPVDVDVAFTVAATRPTTRGSYPVSGTLCVRDARHGMSGTYTIDAATSTYVGSDHGGARLDLVARASDGRTVEVTQAFMANRTPARLDNAIIVLHTRDGARVRLAFEAFVRRADLGCP